jgi:antigen flippase
LGRTSQSHPRIGRYIRAAREAAQGGFARDSVLTGLGSIGTIGLSGLATIVIARELGPYGRGNWAAIFSLATLVATFAALGLPSAAAYGAARLEGTDRRQLIAATSRAALILAVVSLAGYAAVTEVARPGHGAADAVAGGALIAAFTVIQNVSQQLVLVTGRLRWFIAAQLVSAGFAILAVLIVALASRLTLTAVVGIYAGRALVGTAIAAAGITEAGPSSRVSAVRSRASLRLLAPYLGYAFMTFATLSLTQVVQRVDVLLVAGIRGSSAAGRYAVAVQLLELLIVVPGALGFVLFRRGARASEHHWRDAMRALRWVVGIQAVAAAVLFLAAPEVIAVVYGDRYRGATVALRWLMPGAVMLGAQTVASNYIASRGRPKSVLVAWAAGAIIGIGLNLLLIPRYGIAGAAGVSSLAFSVVLAIHIVALRTVRRTDASEADLADCQARTAAGDRKGPLDEPAAAGDPDRHTAGDP